MSYYYSSSISRRCRRFSLRKWAKIEKSDYQESLRWATLEKKEQQREEEGVSKKKTTTRRRKNHRKNHVRVGGGYRVTIPSPSRKYYQENGPNGGDFIESLRICVHEGGHKDRKGNEYENKYSFVLSHVPVKWSIERVISEANKYFPGLRGSGILSVEMSNYRLPLDLCGVFSLKDYIWQIAILTSLDHSVDDPGVLKPTSETIFRREGGEGEEKWPPTDKEIVLHITRNIDMANEEFKGLPRFFY